MGIKDWIMVVACLMALASGLIFPDQTAIFSPYPKACMMGVLFFNFLDILPKDVFGSVRQRGLEALGLFLFKMLVLPALAFFIFKALLPEYALAALLLAGMSCGVAGPVFAAMFEADVAFATALVFLTSMAVPITLPLLVKALAGLTLSVSVWQMMRLLGEVVLVPFFLAELLRRFAPVLVGPCRNVRYESIITLFVIANMGIFSSYGHTVQDSPEILVSTLVAATGLAFLLFFLPLFLFRKNPDTALNAAIGCGIMNNAIAVVFAAEQLGAGEALTAALYGIPYFLFLIPLKLICGKLKNQSTIQSA